MDPAVTLEAPGADARMGTLMLTVFGAAVVLVSLAVAVIALDPTWWMLGAVFALHLAATVVVTGVIARALNGPRAARRSSARASLAVAGAAPLGAAVAHQ